MTSRIPRLALAGVALVAAVGLTMAFRGGDASNAGGQNPPVPVDVATVANRPMPVTVETIGTVQPEASVAVKPRVDGQIAEIRFREGDDVTAGQVLFVLDTRQAEAQLHQYEAALGRDVAQLSALTRDRQRKEELVRRGVSSVAALDAASSADESLQAQIRADKAAVEAQKVILDYSTIRAPLDGRAGAVVVKVGSTVKATDTAPLVTINRIAPIQISFAIAQRELPGLRAAMARGPVTVSARVQGTGASGARSEGTVTFLDNAVDGATGTVQVKATVANADLALWPGQFTDVTVLLDTVPQVAAVPAPAILVGQTGNFAFVVDADGTASVRPVTLIRVRDGIAFLSEGLKAGETVVVEGQSRVSPGAKVAVRNQVPGAGGPSS